MIKNLRKKFIIVAMCSTFVVLTAIMGIVNIVNYGKIAERADRLTMLLAENDGNFDKGMMWDIKSIDKNPLENTDDDREKSLYNDKTMNRKDVRRPDGISPETPFATRFFTVTMDEDGSVISSDMGKIAAITQDDAEVYAKNIFHKNAEKGFKDVYRYRVAEVKDDVMIIFLDCRQDLDNFKAFALTSVAVSTFGFLTVFILVVIFSKVVFRPVEESYEKQKQFITDASHEIKTPLTIIDANTEVLEMESGENQWTKSTRNQIKRLSALTQQLITLSKLDEGTSGMEKSEFSLSDIVMDSVEPFDALVRAGKKNFNISVDENIRFIGDEKAIRQLVGILMDNAVKYSLEQGNITISLKQKGKKIYLEVRNQTEEIPLGKLDKLFERFYRLDSSRNSETGGSGIGLSVAKAIVQSHKGKITACSEDGKSLRVVVEFKV